MPQRTVWNITLAAVAANNIATSQQPAGAGALTLDGSLSSGGTYTAADGAHKIAIASDGNDSTHTFTVVGTNADGQAQTEVITGPNATSVNSTKYYATITSITISAAAT